MKDRITITIDEFSGFSSLSNDEVGLLVRSLFDEKIELPKHVVVIHDFIRSRELTENKKKKEISEKRRNARLGER